MIAAFFLMAGVPIPTGWRPCDGNHSTPDLRGKFLIGAGSRTVPMNQPQGTYGHYGPGFEAAEPLRMEVPVGDWAVEAGERDPDPPERACAGVDGDLHGVYCARGGGEFAFGFGGAPYANYHTGAPAPATPIARPPRP